MTSRFGYLFVGVCAVVLFSSAILPMQGQNSQAPSPEDQAKQARATASDQRAQARRYAALEAARRSLREAKDRLEKLESILPAADLRTPEQAANYAEVRADVVEAEALIAQLTQDGAPSKDKSQPESSSACPDLETLYPDVTNAGTTFRKSFDKGWTKDYPEFIFNAATGLRYWQEAGPSAPRQITSVFAPSTFTTEKILIRVCGLHFNSKPNVSAVTQTVPAGGPQVDDAIQQAPAIGAAAQQNLIAERVTALGDVPAAIFETQPRTKATQPDPCQQLDTDRSAAEAELKQYETLRAALLPGLKSLDASWLPGQTVFFEKLKSEIQGELTTQDDLLKSGPPYSDIAAFRKSRDRSSQQAAALAQLLARYNKLAVDKNFSANWVKLKAEIPKLKGALKNYTQSRKAAAAADPKCAGLAGADAVTQQLSDTIDEGVAIVTDLYNGVRSLLIDQQNIAQQDVNLNRWYAGSAVSVYLYLDPVSSNSLTEISFNFSDPWKPINVPDFVPVALPTEASNAGSPPKPETVTITSQDENTTQIEIQPGDTSSSNRAAVNITPSTAPGSEKQTGNATVSIQVVPPLGSPVPPAAGNSGSGAANGAANASLAPADPSAADSNIPLATHFFERHRFLNFTASGGLLVTRFTQQNYAVQSFPTSVVTTVTTVTNPTSTPPTITITPSTSSLSYAGATSVGPLQQSAVVGFTWYPLGRDTYPVVTLKKDGTPRTTTYAAQRFGSHFGVFVGTSVSSVGPFIVGPTYDIVPGIQLLSGVTLQQRNYLAEGIVPCSAQGNNTSTTTSSSSTTSPTGVTTTTTVTVQTTGGCANPQATVLTGTTVPVNQSLKPAFGFGILLNSALFKTLGFLK